MGRRAYAAPNTRANSNIVLVCVCVCVCVRIERTCQARVTENENWQEPAPRQKTGNVPAIPRSQLRAAWESARSCKIHPFWPGRERARREGPT